MPISQNRCLDQDRMAAHVDPIAWTEEPNVQHVDLHLYGNHHGTWKTKLKKSKQAVQRAWWAKDHATPLAEVTFHHELQAQVCLPKGTKRLSHISRGAFDVFCFVVSFLNPLSSFLDAFSSFDSAYVYTILHSLYMNGGLIWKPASHRSSRMIWREV